PNTSAISWPRCRSSRGRSPAPPGERPVSRVGDVAAPLTREMVLDILEGVPDPEVPVLSVVELGIVRDVRVEGAATGAPRVTVVVTPTYSGCPALQVIEDDIRAALETHGVVAPRIETVYAPAWTTDWLSDEARRKLEAAG